MPNPMIRRKIGAGVFSRPTYSQKIRSVFGSSLIAHWPLDENGGTTAADVSGNGHTITLAGDITMGASIGDDGKPCPTFNGGNFPLYSAGLSGLWSEDEFTVGALFRPTRSDLATQTGLQIYKSTTSLVQFRVVSAGNQEYVRYGTDEGLVSIYSPAVLNQWTKVIFVKAGSEGKLRMYINGQMYESNNTSTWEGTGLTTGLCYLGAGTAGAAPFYGQIQHLFIATRAATKAESKFLSNVRGFPIGISVFGDSISTADGSFWHSIVCGSYNNGITRNFIHSVAAMGIIQGATNLAAQIALAANDDTDKIIITLGTNDNDAGDMVVLQTAVQNGIDALRLSNPRATIYYLNVLPSWTDNTGATPKDKSNIRTAIAAACAAKSVTCWDSFTTPWITAGQTSDGTHPTAAGHAAIATQVLSRL